MATTKASRSKTAKQKGPAKRRPTPASRSAPKQRKGGSKSKGGSKKSPSRANSASRSRSRVAGGSGVANGVNAVRETVEDAGQKVGDAGQRAGHATAKAASKAKIPLIAGGAALVGAAGGAAVAAARSRGSKVLGVSIPKTKVKIRTKDLARTADRVASAGEQIGRLSTSLRELQGTGYSNGNNRHRSPIEVVLQGLTRRS